MNDDFQSFVSDHRVRRAISAMQRSNNIFDIIDPTENQHSAILAWLFNPREGHGQGDAIFKDFLMAAYAGAEDNVHSNKKFFEKWLPSRILATGFHSLHTFREYDLPSKKRLDLLIVDMTNKILVVVENKFGARLQDKQIDDYYKEVEETIRRRPVFKEFSTAHVVVDAYYGGADEEDKKHAAPRNKWAFLDYEWLRAGALRAELQLKRGNQSAALVIAYCEAHSSSEYSSPEEKETDDLLADVAKDYQSVISSLSDALAIDIPELTPSDLDSEIGERWTFANHHWELVERLSETTRFSFIEARLRARYPGKSFDTTYGKRWFSIFDTDWYRFSRDAKDVWPVYLIAYERRTKKNEYGVSGQFRLGKVKTEYADKLRLALHDSFPELKKGKQTANYRVFGRIEGVSHGEVEARVLALYDRLNNALSGIQQ